MPFAASAFITCPSRGYKRNRATLSGRSFGSGAPHDHEWAELKLALCKLFDNVVDPAALLVDKSIGLPGTEMLSIYKPEIIGTKQEEPADSRRLLVETCNMDIAPLVGKQVKEKTLKPENGQFAMTAKEKTTHQVGRLFTYSPVRTYCSTLERNIKDSIFSDASQHCQRSSYIRG